MYKVFPVEGGFQVFWIDENDARRHPVRVQPYKHRQSAYRKAKELNDAAKKIDEMIERDGAIII